MLFTGSPLNATEDVLEKYGIGILLATVAQGGVPLPAAVSGVVPAGGEVIAEGIGGVVGFSLLILYGGEIGSQ